MSNENMIDIRDFGNIQIQPCEDLSTLKGLKKLNLNSGQKIHTSALVSQLPSMMATETLSNVYILELPKGVSVSDLMHYKTGGDGTAYFGDKGIAGHGALYSIDAQAVLLGAFTAMSVASGQYFLAEINNNLTAINQKADKILEFLYGDKKAELLSEVSFVEFAYQNFSSIMAHESQRSATIASLQECRKVAMKDIEFYMSDLDSLVKSKDISDLSSLVKSKDIFDLDAFVNKAFRIKDCLQLATQLYVMSHILEVYYSQNVEAEYLHYVEKDILAYINKCEKRMLASFSAIQMYISGHKGIPLKKVDKSGYEKRIGEVVDSLGNGEELIKRKPLQSVLQSCKKKSVFYLDKDGDVYLKAV